MKIKLIHRQKQDIDGHWVNGVFVEIKHKKTGRLAQLNKRLRVRGATQAAALWGKIDLDKATIHATRRG